MGKRATDRDELAKIFGDNLRAARVRRNLTQAQVAEAVSVSNEFYARLERGKALPSTGTLLALLAALAVTADELFGDAIKPTRLPDSAVDSLPARRAKLARRILALDREAQRCITQLLIYCARRFGEDDNA